MENLNPHIDVPQNEKSELAFARAKAQFPWLTIKHRGTGTHTGRGTSWAGAYDVYELIDPCSPEFGMTGRVAEAAGEINMAVSFANGGNRDGGQWW